MTMLQFLHGLQLRDSSGNVGLAVGPDVTYCRVRITEPASESWEGRGGEVGEELILAKDLIGNVMRNHADVIEEFPGSALVGKSYSPLFPGAIDRGHPSQLGRYVLRTSSHHRWNRGSTYC